MAKMKIAGNAMVITSTIKKEDMYLVNNKATLVDSDNNPAYIFEFDPLAEATLSKYGAIFNRCTRNGNLQMTILIANNNLEEVKYAYADAIISLNDAEEKIAEIIDERKTLIEQTFADVEVEE